MFAVSILRLVMLFYFHCCCYQRFSLHTGLHLEDNFASDGFAYFAYFIYKGCAVNGEGCAVNVVASAAKKKFESCLSLKGTRILHE